MPNNIIISIPIEKGVDLTNNHAHQEGAAMTVEYNNITSHPRDNSLLFMLKKCVYHNVMSRISARHERSK